MKIMEKTKTAIVLGAGGFIGSHLVRRLKQEGIRVKGIDIKAPEFSPTAADEWMTGDLRDILFVRQAIDEDTDELYQLAGDVGGAGYIFTGLNDSTVMHNSAQINLNVAKTAVEKNVKALFFSSSACIYPAENQANPLLPNCAEDSAYPANPDSEYGWEKLFSERVYQAYAKNHGLNVKIARYHNIFGPESAWNNGREKAPAALCRKVAEAAEGASVEVWGDGQQTRSFLYIDDCLDATLKLMRSDFPGPVNIGSEEMISINDFISMISGIAGKDVHIKNIEGPTGVRGRSSDNRLIEARLGWSPRFSLESGIRELYAWVEREFQKTR